MLPGSPVAQRRGYSTKPLEAPVNNTDLIMICEVYMTLNSLYVNDRSQMTDTRVWTYYEMWVWYHISVSNLKFSYRWLWRSQFSVVWRRVLAQKITNVSEENTVFIFTAYFLLAISFRFTIPPWRWRHNAPPKCRTVARLYGVTYRMTIIFIPYIPFKPQKQNCEYDNTEERGE
jgi:hypothetical protein